MSRTYEYQGSDAGCGERSPAWLTTRGTKKMEENGLKGSLAIVAVGVIIGLVGFAVESLRFLLIISLLITVLGGGIAFYAAMQES